jgi:DmsE family decaheme c-type cytochrome
MNKSATMRISAKALPAGAKFELAVCLVLLAFSTVCTAQEAADFPAAEHGYTEDGADTCIRCHDEDDEFPVFSIFSTKHGQKSDERTPFADLQCEACHGPGAEHAKRVRANEKQGPILNFGEKSEASSQDQNSQCLGCHENHARAGWMGSSHEMNDVACASCHTIHVARDPVLDARTQPEKCYDCHRKQRAEMSRASVHPVRFGVMTCTDCHNPHDSVADSLLVGDSLNETCFECHTEKRGPYLWEHAPVAEDCSICHVPHGGNHPSLLAKRAPLLCQQCHSQAGHPSLPWSGSGLPGGSEAVGRQFLLGNSCLNCHSRVHGSNHPSGIKLTR